MNFIYLSCIFLMILTLGNRNLLIQVFLDDVCLGWSAPYFCCIVHYGQKKVSNNMVATFGVRNPTDAHVRVVAKQAFLDLVAIYWIIF